MQPTPDFDAGRLTRSLLRRSRQGALATLMPGTGDPYCSLVNVASHPDGSPILLISRLALHTKNILADPRVSLMLDERRRGDPLEGARVMIAGRAEEAVGRPAGDAAAALPRRPSGRRSCSWIFRIFRSSGYDAAGVHLVAGFGRIVDLDAAKVLTDVSDAERCSQAKQGAVAHMNDDHRDASTLYATKLLGAAEARWRCTGLDPDGVDLAAGDATLRLRFPGTGHDGPGAAQDAGRSGWRSEGSGRRSFVVRCNVFGTHAAERRVSQNRYRQPKGRAGHRHFHGCMPI